MAKRLHDMARELDVDPFEYDKQFAKAKKDWIWNADDPLRVIEWDEHGDKRLIEVGNLVRMHIRLPHSAQAKRNPRRNRDHLIDFALPVVRKSFVAFDMDHPDQPLYLLLDPRVKPQLAKRFYSENRVQAVPMNVLAKVAGGRHSKRQDYDDVAVKPIGFLNDIVYYTSKRGDGPSAYIHKMGEKSHHKPILAAGNDGSLYIVGGNYTCPVPGITD